MAIAEMVLDRFCGREVYPILSASWNLYTDDDIHMSNLCLEIKAGEGITLHDDTKSLHAKPSWEVNLVEKELSRSMLKTGTTFHISKGYDESRGGHVTNFYYCEHEGSESNTIQILAVDGDRLLIRLQGDIVDVNYYDGSKPATKVTVETWFVRSTATMRSVE